MTAVIGALEAVNRHVGHAVRWLAVAMILLQFAIVLLRYVFGISYIFFTETVLYMHAALFMLGAGYTLLVDQHVRVDIFYARYGPRGQALTNLLGGLVLLLPSMGLLAYVTSPAVASSWRILEGSISVGGIPASFLLKSLMTAFCGLIIVQGLAQILTSALTLLSDDAEPAQ